MKKLAMTVSIGALAVGLSACGSSNGPEQTVESFHQALQDEDYQTFCDTLAPDLIDPLEEAAGGASCAEVMGQSGEDLFGQMDEDAELDILESTVSEDDTSATVTFTIGENAQEELSLVKIDDAWKIGSLEQDGEPEGS